MRPSHPDKEITVVSRSDADSWDLSSSVGATATMVAAARAVASSEDARHAARATGACLRRLFEALEHTLHGLLREYPLILAQTPSQLQLLSLLQLQLAPRLRHP